MANSHTTGKSFRWSFRLTLWLMRVRFRLFFRRHLSAIFAITLAIFTVRQEWHKLVHWPPTIELSVALLTLATILAAVWEMWGDKLELSSEQQRFVVAMRMLMIELEKINYGEDKEPDLSKRLSQFVDDFLIVSSNVLSDRKQVESVLMSKVLDSDELAVRDFSKGAKCLKDLKIPIQDLGLDTLGILYIPNWKWKIGFLFSPSLSVFKMERIIPLTWTSDVGLENFRTILCLPIAIYNKKDEMRLYGTLAYFTRKPSSFLSEEIFIAMCFANILNQAFAMAEREASNLTQKKIKESGLFGSKIDQNESERSRPNKEPQRTPRLRASHVILLLIAWLLRYRRQ